MSSLRLLNLSQSWSNEFLLRLPKGLHSFPDKLRYLEWDFYPSKSLGSHFTPRNLVCLFMPDSQLEKLWNDFQVHYMLLYKFFDYVYFEYDFSIKGHIN